MNITVKHKRNYGTDMYYPQCDISKQFAKLTGTVTLTPDSLRIIKTIGYVIDVETPEYSF